MSIQIIGSSGNIADVDSSGNVKVNIEASAGSISVSAAMLPLPAGAAQDGIDNTGISQPANGIGIRGWLSAIYSKLLSGIGVTGTFWQTVQPISAATLPLPTNAAQETSGNLATIALNTATIATNTANETNGSAKSQISDPTSLIAANVVAKGAQATNAIGTQDLKDSGRTYLVLYADRIAGATTEALTTMNINRGGTVTSGTSYTVSAGKTLRIQSVNAEIQNTTTVVNRVLIRVRSATSVLLTSPVIAMALAAASAALAASGDTDPHNFPDGIEIAAGQQIGISQLCTVTTAGIVSFSIIGYEY